MRKKMLSLLVSVVLSFSCVMSVAAETGGVAPAADHLHEYSIRVDETRVSAGTYSHSYICGTNMETGQPIYGECVVTRYQIYYYLLCRVQGCSSKIGPETDPGVEYHGQCGL